jgi:6-phosphogluconolactonase/glucosamine-6-phosphate isomerase/deaminase
MAQVAQSTIHRRKVNDNVWLGKQGRPLVTPSNNRYIYQVLESEDAVGTAMFDELDSYAKEKSGDIVIVLLGGRGAQAMYRIICDLAKTDQIDSLLGRLHVFTQDALAPLRMDNSLSFVNDFQRLLGPGFFAKVKSFTPMQTDMSDPESELKRYIEEIEVLVGIDIFFLGLGPEANAASHLCYIKPASGARSNDLAGIIPISPSILEHHISKFKAGGSIVSEADEAECRNATHILTLGPAVILGARRIVQSIVDVSTTPAKRDSFRRLIDTKLSDDPAELERQADENPGLWLRLHQNVKSFVLPDIFEGN